MKPKYLGRHLMIKGEYIELILSGKKKATIRLGLVKPRYNEMILHGGGRPIAKIKITNVRYKRVKELDEKDAIMDGFKNLEDLIKHLRKAYGNINPDDLVTIIEFEVIQKMDNLEPHHPYLGLEPGDLARIALRYIKDKLNENEIKILMDLTRTNSIRKTALNMFGTLNKRNVVRRILRKALRMLINTGILATKAEKNGLDTKMY